MDFSLSRLPRIDFSMGAIKRLPHRIQSYGRHILIVTGATSVSASPHWAPLISALAIEGISWQRVPVLGEPSPEFIDATVAALRHENFDCVVGIGGGSALDAAKAIAGLLKPGNSVMDHLEGVGPETPYMGPSTPFIAVPTTAGTGSEATKNAVLSTHGSSGFKKSFRDDKLIAEWAIVDPDLLATCPASIIAANGMDAFTQLLESYVSSKANPFTDALARSGMEHVCNALIPWYETRGDQASHRTSMAYAALLSGITLAQVGLGSVHGLASPLGAFFPIPHGVVCGTLLAEATRTNLIALQARMPASPALQKYADVGRLLAQNPSMREAEAHVSLVQTLESWTRLLQLPRLNAYGVTANDIPHIVANSRGSSMKTNPIVLTDEEISQIIQARI